MTRASPRVTRRSSEAELCRTAVQESSPVWRAFDWRAFGSAELERAAARDGEKQSQNLRFHTTRHVGGVLSDRRSSGPREERARWVRFRCFFTVNQADLGNDDSNRQTSKICPGASHVVSGSGPQYRMFYRNGVEVAPGAAKIKEFQKNSNFWLGSPPSKPPLSTTPSRIENPDSVP